MLFNTRQLYTPPLEPHELNRHALIVDTETIGAGAFIELIEIAFGDAEGHIVFHSLVQPTFNPLPQISKHLRFDRAELQAAPDWLTLWPQIAALIDNKILIAYNAAFDRRALAATCSRYRLQSPERGWRCAMQLAKQTLGSKKNLTLEQACSHFGLAGGTHRAVADVNATFNLIRKLIGDGDREASISSSRD